MDEHGGIVGIVTIEDIEIKSVEEDELKVDDGHSDLILIKNQQLVRIRITESFTKETIHQLIESINWK